MYQCEQNRNHIFEDYSFVYDWNSGKYMACPMCGYDEIVPVRECEGCFHWFPVDKMDDGYCMDCLREIDAAEAWNEGH